MFESEEHDPLSLTEQMARNRRCFNNRGRPDVKWDDSERTEEGVEIQFPSIDDLDISSRGLLMDSEPRLPVLHNKSNHMPDLFESEEENDPDDQVKAPSRAPVDTLLRSVSSILEVGGMLGIGTFGCVYRCKVLLPDGSSAHAAVKTFMDTGVQDTQILDTEGALMKGLSHPNLVKLYDVIHSPRVSGLILELCSGGSLQAFIHGQNWKSVFMGLGLAARLAAPLDVARAVQYLHASAVVHRDVKSGNCFLSQAMAFDSQSLPAVKLGDLGSAKQVVQVGGGMTQCVGTVRYMAPEVITTSSYGFEADIFSCGILMHETLSGQVPWGRSKTASKEAALAAIVSGERPNLDGLASDHMGELHGLIRTSWRGSPSERPNADEFVDRLGRIVESCT